MILLTLICVLISLAVVAVAVLWHRFAPAQGALTHEKALYAGFIADVDRRLAAGDLDADAAHEEKIEAARALLKAGDQQTVATVKPVVGVIVTAVTAAAAFGVYMFIGHPGMPDQPYKDREARWTRMAQDDPDSVPPEVMVAVLRQGEAQNGNDPQYWLMIGRFHTWAGNTYEGMKAYKRARAMSPETFGEWSALGEAITLTADGNSNAEALAAFEQALKIDPKDARALYYLGRHQVAIGQFEAARISFRTALANTSPDNPSRPAIEEDLKAIDVAEKADAAARTRIAGMVGSLAASLKTDPENADGWARLLRSYDVLGDTAARAQAEAEMTAHYKARPQIAEAILAKSRQAVGAEATQ
ncbi:cytochrome c-type biogenesis protein cycH [Asticcacaulis biprosthecium C19]|uniref:Cytochrome c-type biogenesis protein cycH n=1 Tax=Asticcacaulis biprosthecium C19 TaxID=715226 RepID=F4QM56_9CAUL|nr:c-type cytochrome biogenesis protein CcmI [Asticcacaulis biprosthecium]EGF91297.1 cytochrome c-type biogenesis protein cycH [Asticcacaulis biprosthecium C19]